MSGYWLMVSMAANMHLFKIIFNPVGLHMARVYSTYHERKFLRPNAHDEADLIIIEKVRIWKFSLDLTNERPDPTLESLRF